MLERLSASLFHPSTLGRFLNDSFSKIILFILFVFSLSTIPYVVSFRNYFELDSSVIKNIANKVIEEESTVSFDGTSFKGEQGFTVVYRNISFSFLEITTNTDTDMQFVFNEKSSLLTSDGLTIGEMNFSEKQFNSFNFSELNTDFKQKQAFMQFLNISYGSLMTGPIIFEGAKMVLTEFLFLALIILFTFLIHRNTNNQLPKSIVLKMAMYSTVIVCVFNLLGGLFGMGSSTWIVGVFFAGMYAYFALKNIVKIKIQR